MNEKVLILILLVPFVQAYFDVQLDRFDLLYQNSSLVDWSSIKVRKVNKIRSIVGEMKFFIPFGNDVIVQLKGYKKQGGEYRLMPYRIPTSPFCDFCAKDEYLYPDIARGSDLPKDLGKDCPIKPGNYKAYNVTFTMENVPKSIVPSGDYAAELIYEKDGKTFIKYRLYATIVSV